MDILVIASDYPDKKRPVYTFVKNLVDAMASIIDGRIFVIAPYSVTHNKSFSGYYEEYITPNNKRVAVYRPNYISVSNYSIGNIQLSSIFYNMAIKKALKKVPHFDACYVHFWKNAIPASKYIDPNIPLFVASGESIIPKFSKSDIEILRNRVSGIICVSSKNRKESIDLGLTDGSNCIILPNGVNTNKFRVLDKSECRRKLNIAENDFVIICVGSFNKRKGQLRIEQALNKIINHKIKAIFIGKGEDMPNYQYTIYQGPVNNDEIKDYLNASDIFVLPTLNEGCCNAIIEAMACGLPIISSNLPFNWDILNDNNSIMVDPTNCQEIADAILTIKNDIQLQVRMRKASIDSTLSLKIETRAKNILDYISSRC